MITKAEWEQMTPQAQWDLFQSLMVQVAEIEATRYDGDPDDELMTYENGW